MLGNSEIDKTRVAQMMPANQVGAIRLGIVGTQLPGLQR